MNIRYIVYPAAVLYGFTVGHLTDGMPLGQAFPIWIFSSLACGFVGGYIIRTYEGDY